jgi:hypothetical protein
MGKTRIPPISIEPREYEKLQLLLDQEGLSVSECVRKLITLYTTYKLSTGKSIFDLDLNTTGSSNINLSKYTFEPNQV